MSLKCLLGLHTWNGCTCGNCGKSREHDWRSDCQRCANCGNTRNEPHAWTGCKCANCAKTRDEGHDWSGDCEKCSRCGKVRQGAHTWDGCTCKACGKAWDLTGVLKPLGGRSDVDEAKALGLLLSRPCTPALVDAIAGHLAPGTGDDLKRGAVVALGILGAPRAVDAMCLALNVDTESLFLLSNLAQALRTIADERATAPLMRWLISLDALSVKVGNRSRFENISDIDGKRFIRGLTHAELIDALGVMRVQEAATYLLGAMQDRETTVSDAAIQALGELGPTTRPSLEAVLSDGSVIAERRSEAASALGATDDPDALSALTTALRDSATRVSGSALEALSEMSDPRAFQAVVDVLEGSDHGSARSAAYHLGEAGQTRAIEPLRRALQSADEEVRFSAAQALANLGDPSGADCLALNLSDTETRRAAATSLAAVADSRAFEPLAAMLANDDEWDRGYAAQGLGRLGDKHAIPILVPLLADAKPFVRLSASSGLAMLGDLRAFDTILRGLWLSGLCSHEQIVAVDALGRCGDARAITELVRALHGAQRKARRPIAAALARLGPPAIDALVTDLSDTRPIVRLHASEALGRIGDRRAEQPLESIARNDSDQRVCAAAALARQLLTTPQAR